MAIRNIQEFFETEEEKKEIVEKYGDVSFDDSQFRVDKRDSASKSVIRYIGTETDGSKLMLPSIMNAMRQSDGSLVYMPGGTIKNMDEMFADTSIVIPPTIPATVTSARYIFANCTSLQGYPVFPANCNVTDAFRGTAPNPEFERYSKNDPIRKSIQEVHLSYYDREIKRLDKRLNKLKEYYVRQSIHELPDRNIRLENEINITHFKKQAYGIRAELEALAKDHEYLLGLLNLQQSRDGSNENAIYALINSIIEDVDQINAIKNTLNKTNLDIEMTHKHDAPVIVEMMKCEMIKAKVRTLSIGCAIKKYAVNQMTNLLNWGKGVGQGIKGVAGNIYSVTKSIFIKADILNNETLKGIEQSYMNTLKGLDNFIRGIDQKFNAIGEGVNAFTSALKGENYETQNNLTKAGQYLCEKINDEISFTAMSLNDYDCEINDLKADLDHLQGLMSPNEIKDTAESISQIQKSVELSKEDKNYEKQDKQAEREYAELIQKNRENGNIDQEGNIINTNFVGTLATELPPQQTESQPQPVEINNELSIEPKEDVPYPPEEKDSNVISFDVAKSEREQQVNQEQTEETQMPAMGNPLASIQAANKKASQARAADGTNYKAEPDKDDNKDVNKDGKSGKPTTGDGR